MARRWARLGVAVLLLGLLAPAPAAAQEEDRVGYFRSVVLVPPEGRPLRWGNDLFAGRLEIRAANDGLVVVEHVDPERYLLGLEEVPSSWHGQALRAQVVAARTYLAWTLSRGRAGAGATYGFDICATDACQVYRGVARISRSGGDRWLAAVRDTAGEILVHEGRPAQALYSSTSGGRTRAVEDVFTGSGPLPYLQPVDSPGEESPYTDWRFEIASWKLADVLREAGYLVGPDIGSIEVVPTEDGEGPWRVRMLTGAGRHELTANQFRVALNRYGPRRHPEDLPGTRANGQRYPQVILSYTYQAESERRIPEELRPDRPVIEDVVVIRGQGWGHQVGMSQYGAKALADRGSDYPEILAHYYGGLVPQQAGEHLPGQIAVGLGWGLDEVTVAAEGPSALEADGEEVVSGAVGGWTFRFERGMVAVDPPEGFGLPPAITSVAPVSPAPAGRAVVVRGVLSTPAEVRMVVFRGAEVVATTDPAVREAGPVVLTWDGSTPRGPAPPGVYTILIEGSAPGGDFHAFTSVVVGYGPG